MNGKEKEFYDILFKNCTEKEIYEILLKKKEIDDKTPKLRTEDDNKMLKCLFNKMRKFPKVLTDEIKKNVRPYKENLKQLNKEQNKKGL